MKGRVRTFRVVVISAFIAGMAVIATGQLAFPGDANASTEQPEYSVTRDEPGLTDPDELEAFMDEFVQGQMDEHHIPGATVAVVKDGVSILVKGYGYSNVEKQTPVSADETFFRVGSVSKLFTWTAVMQLVEKGQLDLNTDINMYLADFRIPDTFTEPITLSHLLTHTPGLASRFLGTEANSAEDLLPLGEFLATNMPDRVRPPGELTAYSNHGAALAGYIVEQVSGVPFYQYIEEKILKPLDMSNSTFQQPLPSSLASNGAPGYLSTNDTTRAGQFQYFQLAPAGGMSTTAGDMARFMIAHLQGGFYNGNRILQERTARDMQQQHFIHDYRLSGIGYGFIERNLNTQRLIMHTGGTRYFSTLVVLLPEHGAGLFISYNCGSRGAALEELLQTFLDRYYPIPDSPTLEPPADFQKRAGKYVGTYRPTNRRYTTIERVGELFNLVTVTASRDDVLLLRQGGYGPRRRIEVEPLVFSNVYDWKVLIFREDNRGRITHMFDGDAPQIAFVKLSWHETPTFHCILLGMCTLAFLSVLRHPTRVFRARRRDNVNAPRPLLPRLAHWMAVGISALNSALVIILFIQLGRSAEIVYGVPGLTYAGLTAALASPVLMIGVVTLSLQSWRKRYWRLTTRLHYTLVALAGSAFVWQLWYFNLLGFHF
jgi:CubicO group peptidase (beta-lactamase class C family)